LANLREALSGGGQSNLPDQQAKKFKDKNPTLHHQTALRRQGFLRNWSLREFELSFWWLRAVHEGFAG
jgi:hypothetical protein